MKGYIFSTLCMLGSLTTNLQAQQMDNSMPGGSMMGGSNMMQNMMQSMMEVTENELLSSWNNQEREIYQQLNPQQKALIIKAANQFSCRARMQMMHERMMQQGMNQQGMMNR